MHENLFALLPHRGVDTGKSRLAGIIDDATRSALNRWLLEHTVRVVSAWLGDVTRCIVVSPCPRTLALAREAGATALHEHAPTQGLNAALSQGAAHAASCGAQRLLILPCDLPYLDEAALHAMHASSQAAAAMVIAPDRHRVGTNALLVSAAMRDFAFGENSFSRHAVLAADHGMPVVPLMHTTLAFDLDSVDDYAEWLETAPALPSFIPASSVRLQSRA